MAKVEIVDFSTQLRNMLEKGFEDFSISRIDPVGVNNTARMFLEEMEIYFGNLANENLGVISGRRYSKNPTQHKDLHSTVFIFGSSDENLLNSTESTLLDLVKRCPEGPLADALKNTHIPWGKYGNLYDLMKDGKRHSDIVKVGLGPRCYTSREMRDIAGLFLPDL